MQMIGETEAYQKLMANLRRSAAAQGIDLETAMQEFDAPPVYQCEVCEDKGMIRLKRESDIHPTGYMLAWARCTNPKCEAARNIQRDNTARLLKYSGLPGMYAGFTFETFIGLPMDQRTGKQLAASAAYCWAVQEGDGFNLHTAGRMINPQYQADNGEVVKHSLVLQGGLGLGKTGLAAAAVNAMADRGRTVLFYRVQELFKEVQGEYGKDDSRADEIIERVQNSEALILDEMNIPNVSADKQRIIEEIIRYRHARNLPTMLTCNVDLSAFSNMWGERSADVVYDMAHWITLGGVKLRRGVKPTASF